MDQIRSDTIRLTPSQTFVKTEKLEEMVNSALLYLKAGLPIHFSGPTGTGKTTMALHVARLLEKPSILFHGDDEFGPSNLLSNKQGFSRQKVVDNFIHSVVKVQESFEHDWMDSRLITACREGYTLIYDEFTRSRPEANNLLLSILEERILCLPSGRNGRTYLKVHPEFDAIFTSNPEEYAGVHKSQEALKDRMVTINIEAFDPQTEVEIIAARSTLPKNEVKVIMELIKQLRKSKEVETKPTIRRSIMIAKALVAKGLTAQRADANYWKICWDILVEEPSFHMSNPQTPAGMILLKSMREERSLSPIE